LPHQDRYNLLVPRSACSSCGYRISAVDSIPVLSWLALRGRCRHCGTPISIRYPAVELIAGLLSALLVWTFGPSVPGFAALLFAYLLLAMATIDFETKLLPDDLAFVLLWAGLLVNLNGTFVPLRSAVIGAAVGYLALWAVYWVFKLATGKEGMGYGDFKLMAALGAWLGWAMLPTIILLSSLVGAIAGVLLIVLNGRARDNPIPYGPFIAAAGMIAMLYGERIASQFQHFG
jgi:leader peptidase (prepilin peptidase)/N-methyltransferase